MLDTPPGGKRKRESRHYEGISLDCILATSKCAEQRRTITPRRFKFAVKQVGPYESSSDSSRTTPGPPPPTSRWTAIAMTMTTTTTTTT